MTLKLVNYAFCQRKTWSYCKTLHRTATNQIRSSNIFELMTLYAFTALTIYLLHPSTIHAFMAFSESRFQNFQMYQPVSLAPICWSNFCVVVIRTPSYRLQPQPVSQYSFCGLIARSSTAADKGTNKNQNVLWNLVQGSDLTNNIQKYQIIQFIQPHRAIGAITCMDL